MRALTILIGRLNKLVSRYCKRLTKMEPRISQFSVFEIISTFNAQVHCSLFGIFLVSKQTEIFKKLTPAKLLKLFKYSKFTKPATKSGSSKIIIEATFIGRSTANKRFCASWADSYILIIFSLTIFCFRVDFFLIEILLQVSISFTNLHLQRADIASNTQPDAKPRTLCKLAK